MRILVQGIGCTETGARIVLRELLTAAPADCSLWVVTTSETASEFIGRRFGRLGPNVRIWGLSHRWFGRWLRLPLEWVLAVGGLIRAFDRIVNLSHYGLCLGGRYTLYIHSPLLMDTAQGAGWGEGRPNRLKRWMLDSCIRRAELIVLQTAGMKAQLVAYCSFRGFSMPRAQVVRPMVEVSSEGEPRRAFEFQLFYPTSRFVHKRAELALAAGRLAHAQDASMGLVITVPAGTGPDDGVRELGRISREEVYEWFAGSDALLFTSERETLGLPLLEALEFGLPVIAPRLPYALELLGDAGCYFEGDSPESVAAAIMDCRNNAEAWRAKIKSRSVVVKKDAATWRDHWRIFLSKHRAF